MIFEGLGFFTDFHWMLFWFPPAIW
jgi:hypothetical protein